MRSAVPPQPTFVRLPLIRCGRCHKLLVTLSAGRPDDYGDEYRGR